VRSFFFFSLACSDFLNDCERLIGCELSHDPVPLSYTPNTLSKENYTWHRLYGSHYSPFDCVHTIWTQPILPPEILLEVLFSSDLNTVRFKNKFHIVYIIFPQIVAWSCTSKMWRG